MPVAMADLLRTLEAEADAVVRFVDLLKLEQESLANGNIDALAPIIQQKNSVATELATFAKQRNASLASKGFGPDRAGVEAWCERHPSDTRAGATWSRILLLASEARELNRVNGELIKIRMQHNTQALEALLGASQSLDLYGPDGQAASRSNRRINDAA
jgi:flagella synthesis protein FlgN